MKKGLKRQIRELKEENRWLRTMICAILTEAGGEVELPDPPQVDYAGFQIAKNEETGMIELRGSRPAKIEKAKS